MAVACSKLEALTEGSTVYSLGVNHIVPGLVLCTEYVLLAS